MPIIDRSILQPGDSILYRPSNLIGVIIALKTVSWTSHIEVIVSATTAIGARQEGVNEYQIRNDKYVNGVLRPTMPVDMAAGMEWFNKEAKGDKYSVGGLFQFFDPDGPSVKPDPDGNYKAEFCSQLAVMFYRHAGFQVFSPNWPAQKVAPAQFWQTPLMKQIYP